MLAPARDFDFAVTVNEALAPAAKLPPVKVNVHVVALPADQLPQLTDPIEPAVPVNEVLLEIVVCSVDGKTSITFAVPTKAALPILVTVSV